ncbi:MAG: non-homologous end joining protein Ku [Thermoplasmatota archaeon]
MQTTWKGNLSWGLLTLPVRMYKATAPTRIAFRTLHAEDNAPIKEKRVCSLCGKEVPWSDVAKGVELPDGRFISVTKEELAKTEPESSVNLKINEFVNYQSIDPSYMESSYVLAPEKGGDSAYRLLARVMEHEKKAAIGKVATRGREHLVALRSADDLLYVEMLHFPEEIRDLSEVRATVGKGEPDKDELEMATLLVNKLTKPWDPERYHDEYGDRVRALVEAKAAGAAVKGKAPQPKAPSKNLLEALRESLEGSTPAKDRGSHAHARASSAKGSRSKAKA